MHAEVDIKASPQRVWAILDDVDHYSEWNPFFVAGSGQVDEGKVLHMTMAPVGESTKSFSPVVLEVDPGRRLVWRGRLLMPGVFDGTHRFVIEPLDEGHVRVTQDEDFRGVLVPFVGLGPYRAGWERMNEALKRRAEGD